MLRKPKCLLFFLSFLMTLILTACNSGGSNSVSGSSSVTKDSANSGTSVTKAMINDLGGLLFGQETGLVISDMNTPVEYNDTLENVPVGKFGLKRILVTNNLAESLFNLQLPNNLPENIQYNEFRTTCALNNKQTLSPQGSCMIVLQYMPKVEGEKSSFNFSVSAVTNGGVTYTSNIKNIPYSSRIASKAKISFSQNKISTIGGYSETVRLNYTGPLISSPIKVNLSANGVSLSTNECIFDSKVTNCEFSVKAERNSQGNFIVKATSPNMTIDDLEITVNAISCTLVDDVKTSPYEVPRGFMLRPNECLMVTDQDHQFISVLKFTGNYIPETNLDACDFREDPNCAGSFWIPFQGVHFDEYLSSINKDALELCTSQPYYNSKMIGIPTTPMLRFAQLQHGPNKGKYSLFEDSIAYLGANLYLWDSLTDSNYAPADNRLVITTDGYYNDISLITNDGKSIIWSSSSSVYNFNTSHLATGKELCQFYVQWQ